MRRAERTLRDERYVLAQLASYGMYLCGFQTLRERERRKNGRQTLSHHRLTRTRRSYHDEVVSASRSYFQGTFHILLTSHVSIVEVEMTLVLVEFLAGIDDGGRRIALVVHELDDLEQVCRTPLSC